MKKSELIKINQEFNELNLFQSQAGSLPAQLLYWFVNLKFFQDMPDDAEVDYSLFENFCTQQRALLSLNFPLLEKLRRWKFENQETFMGSRIRAIPDDRLIYLDNRYEDAEEILDAMKSNAKQGKNIFLNPNTVPNNLFSQSAIQTLRNHPICKDFIIQHEIEQARLAKIDLPDKFYDKLHAYLMEIFHIGKENSASWGYMTSDGGEDYAKLGRCLDLRKRFFEKLNTVCNETQKKALPSKIISVQRRVGSSVDATFHDVINGEGEFICIIEQQIFLWAMLRNKKPDIEVPDELRRHPQALFFNLGNLPASSTTESDQKLELIVFIECVYAIRIARQQASERPMFFRPALPGNSSSRTQPEPTMRSLLTLFSSAPSLTSSVITVLDAINGKYTGPHLEKISTLRFEIGSLGRNAPRHAIISKIENLTDIGGGLGYGRVNEALISLRDRLNNNLPLDRAFTSSLEAIVSREPRTLSKRMFNGM